MPSAAPARASRALLNLTDGVVGQGLDVLVCVTTNEELSRLHPAIVRPGRCLAQIHVGPLPADEAAAWLGRSTGIGRGGATLAELYARAASSTRSRRRGPTNPSGCTSSQSRQRTETATVGWRSPSGEHN